VRPAAWEPGCELTSARVHTLLSVYVAPGSA
jgi:hypothetical protein